MTNEKIIKKLGLEDAEAKVYLALIELGPATVSEITKKAGITRTHGYHILEKLSWNGLVDAVSGKGAKIKYGAKHPRRLVQYLTNKKNAWDKKIKEAENILPDLVSIYKVAEKPVVRYIEGYPGIIDAFNETLGSKTEILAIFDLDAWAQSELYEWVKNYYAERNKKKIHERILLWDTKEGRQWVKDKKRYFDYSHYHLISPEQLPGVMDFGGEINIYENKILIALLKKPNPMAIIIESAVLVNILKAMFELAYKVARPVDIKKLK